MDENMRYLRDDAGEIIAQHRVNCVSWYQANLSKLFVPIAFRKRGHAKQLIRETETYLRSIGILVMQCTIRVDNIASIRLHLALGFTPVNVLVNPNTGHEIAIFQKKVEGL